MEGKLDYGIRVAALPRGSLRSTKERYTTDVYGESKSMQHAAKCVEHAK